MNYKVDEWYEKFSMLMILINLNNHIYICSQFAAPESICPRGVKGMKVKS